MRLPVLLALFLLHSAGFAFAQEASRYAAFFPLTGNGADQGVWCKNGLEIAAAHLNAGGDRVELRFEDTRGDPKTAVMAYKSLGDPSKFSAVLTWGSGVGIALSPLVNQDEIIQMGVATVSPQYRSVGDFTFRISPAANDEAKFLAEVLSARFPAGKMVSMFIRNDFGVGTVEALREALKGRHLELAASEGYNPGETDFRSQLLKLRELHPAVIHLAAYPADGALILKQARELGLSSQFVASVAIAGGSDFFTSTGPASEGLLVSSTIPDSSNPFFREYEGRFGKGPVTLQLYAARAFDALTLLEESRKACAGAHACMRVYLTRVSGFKGASGGITFDEAGDSHSSFKLFRVSGGELIPAD